MPTLTTSISRCATPILLILAGCVLSACAGETKDPLPQHKILDASNAYWIARPDALIGFETREGSAITQTLTLPNATDDAGDNTIRLRVVPGVPSPRLTAESVAAWNPDAPADLTGASVGALFSRNDAAGAYFWVQTRPDPDALCVFAFRRITRAHREIPHAAESMDVALRHCLPGEDISAALDPITATALLKPACGDVALNTLNPLAAPLRCASPAEISE